MCGIAGIVSSTRDPDEIEDLLRKMIGNLYHRGPDQQSLTVTTLASGVTVGLGHTRLSIIDLSAAASQPMWSESGRHAIIFNGEIYNYKELKPSRLPAGSGDTRVLFDLLQTDGPRSLSRLNGMWAFAYLDLASERLILCRDRLGKKPLYVLQKNGEVFFASEMKAILAAFETPLPLDVSAIHGFLRDGSLNVGRETFFKEIKCFPAAHHAGIRLDNRNRIELGSFIRYWSFPEETSPLVSIESTIAELRELFENSVQIRLRSDVPLGVLLSGGLDSSSIVAACRSSGFSSSMHAFTVVSDSPYSEETYADEVAEKYQLTVSKIHFDSIARDLYSEMSDFIWFNEQPTFSLTPVARHTLVRKARAEGYKVLLTGQGADEQLAGYSKYFYLHFADLIRGGNIIDAVRLFGGAIRNRTVIPAFQLNEAKRYIPWNDWLLRASSGDADRHRRILSPAPSGNSARDRERFDLTSGSLPALLHYEDRSSMASGTEIRCPFLDYRIVELLARAPMSWKLRGGWPKYIFRKAMEPILLKRIVWRSDKNSFSVPEDRFLRESWKPALDRLFSSDMQIYERELASRNHVRKVWERYLKKDLIISYKDVLKFVFLELWLERFGMGSRNFGTLPEFARAGAAVHVTPDSPHLV